MNNFIKSIIGGIFIALGGTCFLSIEGKIVGSFMFALGLYAICCTKQLLFTGRCPYTSNLGELGLVLLGNYIGATSMGLLISYTKPKLFNKANAMCQIKMSQNWYQILVFSILCNVLIYIAVEAYKVSQPGLLIMCVMGFILCGFEHSIADMFYFAVARRFNWVSFGYLICIALGNFAGGQIIRTLRLLTDKE